jgi:hypothetical protein
MVLTEKEHTDPKPPEVEAAQKKKIPEETKAQGMVSHKEE